MHTKEKKRRVRIILTVVTTVIALALLATALVFILRTDEKDADDSDSNSNNAIDLEDVLSGQLYAKRFNGSWSNGNSLIYKENTVGLTFEQSLKRVQVV